MTDPLHPDRLLRKRNSNLQKQLDFTLQILSEEYRQSKERLYKEERDCGKFLQSLYETVPGLQAYGQPDTRSMKPGNLHRQRYFSDGSTASDPDDNRPSEHSPSHPMPSSLTEESGSSQKTGHIHTPRGKRLGTEIPETKSTQSSSAVLRKEGQNSGLGRRRFQISRPKTAGASNSNQSYFEDRSASRSRRPATSFGLCCKPKSTIPRFGKCAYSDHDRIVQEIVRKKFQSIFYPEVRKCPKGTTCLSVVMPDTEHDSRSGSDNEKDSCFGEDDRTKESADDNQICGSPFTGQERRNHPKLLQHRRMVWSARQCRKPASVCKSGEDTMTRPASASVESTAYSKTRSHSLSMHGRNLTTQSTDECGNLEHTRARLCSDVQGVDSHTKGMVNGDAAHNKESGEPQQDSKEQGSRRSSLSQQTASLRNVQEAQSKSQSKRSPKFIKSKSDSNVLSARHAPRNSVHNEMKKRSPQTNGQTTTAAHVTSTKQGTETNPGVSEVGLVLAQEQLVDRLMNAGRSRPRLHPTALRPKTAPSRSELSHRLTPVSRKIIMGILSEIDNQKASTRTMLTTSKELQDSVKRLVPEEYLVELDETD